MYNNKGYNKNFRGTSNSPSPTPQQVSIKHFYIEGTKDVRPELFDEVAKGIAKSFIGTNKEGRPGKVTKTQIRRLYDEVNRFNQVLDGSPGKWEKNRPYVKMIKSKASYNITRAKQEPPFVNDYFYDNLYEFIKEGIDLIKEENDYPVFKALFEAVYGYYYVLNPKKD